MTDASRHLSTRMPATLIDQLDELAQQRRKESGSVVHRADLVREAVELLVQGSVEEEDYGDVILGVLNGLSSLTRKKGLDDVEEIAAAIRPAAEHNPRMGSLRSFARSLSAALDAT